MKFIKWTYITQFFTGIWKRKFTWSFFLVFDQISDNRVCRLRKFLYGLKQAPGCWFEKLTIALRAFGFIHSRSDLFFFVYTKSHFKFFFKSMTYSIGQFRHCRATARHTYKDTRKKSVFASLSTNWAFKTCMLQLDGVGGEVLSEYLYISFSEFI